jgi:beta-aspartyl-peptidase (threonine type)
MAETADKPGARRLFAGWLPPAAGGVVLGIAVTFAGLTWWEASSRVAGGAEVQRLLQSQVAAWNRGDLDEFLLPYWDDSRLTFFSGATVTEGLRQLKERYQKRYQSEGKEMGKLAFSDVEVITLASDVALARGRWKVTRREEALEGLFTLTVLRRPDGWKIVHDHTSSK